MGGLDWMDGWKSPGGPRYRAPTLLIIGKRFVSFFGESFLIMMVVILYLVLQSSSAFGTQKDPSHSSMSVSVIIIDYICNSIRIYIYNHIKDMITELIWLAGIHFTFNVAPFKQHICTSV